MLIGSWGLYTWFEEYGEDLIQQQYREGFRSLQPFGKLFLCVREDDNEYIELQYNKQKFKVKPALFKKVSTPEFSFGESVRVKRNPETIGVICDINWHHKYEKEFYFIEVNGKKKSSRYFKEDLLSFPSINQDVD